MNYEIYTDGSCSPHSGKAGCWAYVVVVDDEVITEDYGIHSSTTNSKMEILAMKEALSPVQLLRVRGRDPIRTLIREWLSPSPEK